MTGRRQFLASGLVLAAGLLPTARPVHGQPAGRPSRIGILLLPNPATDPNVKAFVGGLAELGYVDGRNVVLEYRSAEGRPERIGELAVQLVAAKPDIVVVLGGDLLPFAKRATSTIPIVMLTSQDPVEAGVVASFARPGGNITGVAFVSSETAAKRLQFLKEAAPAVARVGVLWSPDHPDGEFRQTAAAGQRLGMQVQSLEVTRPEQFDAAFQAALRERAQALLVVSSRFMNVNRTRVLEFAGRHALPVVTGWGPWARDGSFMSYGPDLNALVRRAATHVDKILKGARPGDIPVEQPDKFELVVNLKTARALGIAVPSSVLLRADHVIE